MTASGFAISSSASQSVEWPIVAAGFFFFFFSVHEPRDVMIHTNATRESSAGPMLLASSVPEPLAVFFAAAISSIVCGFLRVMAARS